MSENRLVHFRFLFYLNAFYKTHPEFGHHCRELCRDFFFNTNTNHAVESHEPTISSGLRFVLK